MNALQTDREKNYVNETLTLILLTKLLWSIVEYDQFIFI